MGFAYFSQEFVVVLHIPLSDISSRCSYILFFVLCNNFVLYDYPFVTELIMHST